MLGTEVCVYGWVWMRTCVRSCNAIRYEAYVCTSGGRKRGWSAMAAPTAMHHGRKKMTRNAMVSV